jgi:hypothetical protein
MIPQTRRPSKDKLIRIGVDTSKNVFVLHGVGAAEQPVLRVPAFAGTTAGRGPRRSGLGGGILNNADQCMGAGRGSMGVMRRNPSMSSISLAPASTLASARGGPTICKPTGRSSLVNPHGRDNAGQHTSVIA